MLLLDTSGSMSDCKTSSELAEEHGCPESEFDFTIAFAVAGERRIGFFHVGDGRSHSSGTACARRLSCRTRGI